MKTTNIEHSKLIHLEAKDWLKFQENLKKKLLLAEFYQVPAQQRVGNGESSNVQVPTKHT